MPTNGFANKRTKFSFEIGHLPQGQREKKYVISNANLDLIGALGSKTVTLQKVSVASDYKLVSFIKHLVWEGD